MISKYTKAGYGSEFNIVSSTVIPQNKQEKNLGPVVQLNG